MNISALFEIKMSILVQIILLRHFVSKFPVPVFPDFELNFDTITPC